MSRPLETLYATPRGSQVVKPFTMLLGEKRRINVDWNAYLAYQDATISSSTWASEGQLTSPGSSTSTDGITSTLLTPSTGLGVDSVKNTVTLSTGEKLVRKFRVELEDPLEFVTSGGRLPGILVQSDEFDASDYGGTIPTMLSLTEVPDRELFTVYFDGVLQPADNYSINDGSESLVINGAVDRTWFQHVTVVYSY